MSTKRTPISRPARRQISPAVVEIYRELCKLDQVRDACDKGKPDSTCKLPWSEFCKDCTRRQELSHQLYFALKLKPWQYPFGYRPQEPAGLTASQRDAFWAEQLETALAEALSW